MVSKRQMKVKLFWNPFFNFLSKNFDHTFQFFSNKLSPNWSKIQLDVQIKKVSRAFSEFLFLHFDSILVDPSMFKIVEFLLPDPTELNLDGNIPNILVQYFRNGQLDEDQLNDYMSKYAFTPVVENGN